MMSVPYVEQRLNVSQPSEWFWIELAELNPDALTFDGFCSSVVGYAAQYTKLPVVVYDHEKMLETLMVRDGMTYQEAEEFISFNTAGAWLGEHTPMIMRMA